MYSICVLAEWSARWVGGWAVLNNTIGNNGRNKLLRGRIWNSGPSEEWALGRSYDSWIWIRSRRQERDVGTGAWADVAWGRRGIILIAYMFSQ